MRSRSWWMALLFVLPFPVLANEAPLAELLPRLVAAEEAREQRRERLTTLATTVWEELDGEGKATSRLETVERSVWRGGKRSSELVRATRDGKDVTGEVREQREKEEGVEDKGRTFQLDHLPFSPREQARYHFEARGPDAKQPHLLRVAFSPKEGKRLDALAGEALVDAGRGELLRLTTHPSKLPKLADKIEMVLEFDAATDEGRNLSRIRAYGEGGVLFIKKRIRTVTTLAYVP
ncbi:MAG: hypothetical protein ABW123_02925 [Cystobacter sp.]